MRDFNVLDISIQNNTKKQVIDDNIMEYMVWIVEIVSNKFFGNDKTLTYKTLKDNGIWDLYVQNYDVTHTLSSEYILLEIKELLDLKNRNGV